MPRPPLRSPPTVSGVPAMGSHRSWEESVDRMERALAASSILGESEKRNARLKAQDLWSGRTTWESTPLRLQIESHRRCQLSCFHCEIEHDPATRMDPARIERIFEAFGEGVIEAIPYIGGEPTLGSLEDFAALCRRYHCWMTFTTNGLLLDGARFRKIADACGRVVFSFHAHREDLWRRIEPRLDFARLLTNLRACVAIAAAYDIQMLAGIVLLEANIDHLAAWFQTVADLGIRQVGFTKCHPNTPDAKRIDPYCRRAPAEIEDLVGRGMEVALRNGIFVETNIPEAYYTRYPENRPRRTTRFDILQDMNGICSLFRPGFCPLLANLITVEWDGTVVPCCRAHMVLGREGAEDLRSIWNGERIRRLRSTFARRSILRECSGCMDFYSDPMHPSVPPMADEGTWFAQEYGAL